MTNDKCRMMKEAPMIKRPKRDVRAGFRHSFVFRRSSSVIQRHVLIPLKILSAFSSVSLLPISSHFPLISYVFTGLRV